MKKVLNFIGLLLFFLFIIFAKTTSFRFRFSFYYLVFIPVVYLLYKFSTLVGRPGKWYIDKTVLLIAFPFIVIVIAYTYAGTEGTDLIKVLLATLMAIVLALLFALNKRKEGVF